MTQPLQRLAELPKTGLEQLRFYLMVSGPREKRPRSLNGDSAGGGGCGQGWVASPTFLSLSGSSPNLCAHRAPVSEQDLELLSLRLSPGFPASTLPACCTCQTYALGPGSGLNILPCISGLSPVSSAVASPTGALAVVPPPLCDHLPFLSAAVPRPWLPGDPGRAGPDAGGVQGPVWGQAQ